MDQGLNWSRLVESAGLIGRCESPVDPLITSVVEDSRLTGPGSCFVAVRGTQVDGHDFIDKAISAGASAIVCEREVALPPSVACLRLNSARGVAGRLAATLSGLDRRLREGELKVIGITGTNGKSTFCFLLHAILRAAGKQTAMFGTVQYDLVSRQIESSMTTPPATTIVQYLGEAADAGATHAVMEVSSHALDQGRCDGMRFAVGVFSNLTGDHLDYHHDMESYLRAKRRLFDGLDEKAAAVVNQDDRACERMIAQSKARILRYGLKRPNVCDLTAVVHERTAAGTRFELQLRNAMWLGPWQPPSSCRVTTPLIGTHNIENCLAAAGAGVALGIPLETIAAGLESVKRVPGRLERVSPPAADAGSRADLGFAVLVDYAHTDDALENVLSALKPLTRGRLIVLFGCGGDRDRMKRPRMAKVVARWADGIFLTSDNPRTEDPKRIIDDVLAGFEGGERSRVHVEADRRQAIDAAIRSAAPGDIVLLAGKGHEAYQLIGRERLPFDDAAVAAEVMAERIAGSAGSPSPLRGGTAGGSEPAPAPNPDPDSGPPPPPPSKGGGSNAVSPSQGDAK